MTTPWDSGERPVYPAITVSGWLRVVLRVILLVGVIVSGFWILLLIRLVERPLCGVSRPVTPRITRMVCRVTLMIIGLKHQVRGTLFEGRGAVVANHAAWLDIFSLNAAKCIYFVSKSEVANWSGIGWLARATGTVFIERNPAKAHEQTKVFQRRLLAGHRLLFFPEGTSTDGFEVLPFKTTLFEAFFAPELRDSVFIQPVSVFYIAPPNTDPRFYGWWGDMSLGPHLISVLAERYQGSVTIQYHPPLRVADFQNRKELALACEKSVRAGHAKLSGQG